MLGRKYRARVDSSSPVRSPPRSGSVPFVLRSRRIGLTLSSRRRRRIEGRSLDTARKRAYSG